MGGSVLALNFALPTGSPRIPDLSPATREESQLLRRVTLSALVLTGVLACRVVGKQGALLKWGLRNSVTPRNLGTIRGQ
jgi:hypothetical protein